VIANRRGADAGGGEQAQEDIGIKEIENDDRDHGADSAQERVEGRCEVLKHLEQSSSAWCSARTRRSTRWRHRSSWRGPGCASRKSRWSYLFSGRPASAARGGNQLAGRWASNDSGSTCGNMERHTVVAPDRGAPGYVASTRWSAHRRRDQHPHCVVLLDEIEKAHPDLYNVLLSDHGSRRLTDHTASSEFPQRDSDHDHQCRAAICAAGFGFTRTREGTITRDQSPVAQFRNRLDASSRCASQRRRDRHVVEKSCCNSRRARRPHAHETVGAGQRRGCAAC